MTYRIEIDNDDVVILLASLENLRQDALAARVRDQVNEQRQAVQEREKFIDDIAENWANTLTRMGEHRD